MKYKGFMPVPAFLEKLEKDRIKREKREELFKRGVILALGAALSYVFGMVII